MGAMNRRLRLGAALLAIAAMLFAPLAMALQACDTMLDRMTAIEAMAARQAAQEAGAAPMDMALCEHHCAQLKPSFDLAKPQSPIVPPVVPALRVDAPEVVALAAPAFDSPFAAGPAPPLIGFTVLRI
jgi:hypothetical protein